MGVSNRSIRITSEEPVTVYALNQRGFSADATNILPVKALDVDYYQISYTPFSVDAYAVVAIKDNTNLYHNKVWEETLDAGEVYYRTSSDDMTGSHITADNPVAFFAVTRTVQIPADYEATDCLFQQLAPINTWGQAFFVPVSHLAKDRVRIVASQDGTTITQTDGTFIYSSSGTYTIDAGEYIELETLLTNNGCYIDADKPVGVCTYLVGAKYNGMNISDPAQCWLPAIEQTVTEALIAPFAPTGGTALNAHYALVVTPTVTQENTKVSIGGAPPASLSGGSWIDNTASGMSFYTMPLADETASYYFTNDAGLIILCYGTGPAESYYYLAYSAMRDLQAAFYANDIHYQDLENNPICENVIEFRAETENMGVEVVSLEWYIDGVEYLPAHNQETWSKTFAIG
ncbi:MAG: IgGFc-binding protein, partial [Bacteroidales bacterium]|nr:IgGFc-binding protein [Bacteroidales bacterium]